MLTDGFVALPHESKGLPDASLSPSGKFMVRVSAQHLFAGWTDVFLLWSEQTGQFMFYDVEPSSKSRRITRYHGSLRIHIPPHTLPLFLTEFRLSSPRTGVVVATPIKRERRKYACSKHSERETDSESGL